MPPGRPRAAAGGLAALFVSALWLTGGCAAQWTVLPGQPLADAATAWGLQNSDATFALPAASIVSLRDATFRLANNSQARGGKAYANGTFTIQGSVQVNASSRGAVASSVFDAGNREGLTPTLMRRAAVTVSDFALVNSCYASASSLGLTFTTPLLFGLFRQLFVIASLRVRRAILFMPRSTIAISTYLSLNSLTPTHWQAVQARYTQQLSAVGFLGTEIAVRYTSAYEINIRSTLLPLMEGDGIVRSLDTPGDPLLKFMRDEGLIMPPRWCSNGSLVDPQVANAIIDPFWGPLWMGDTQERVVSAIVNATAAAAGQQAAQHPVPAVMVDVPVLALSDASLPSGQLLQLNASLILWGVHDEDMTRAPVTLDLSQRTLPVWRLGPAGQLFVQRVVLIVPASPLGATAAAISSSLPLTALATAAPTTANGTSARVGAVVELHNVTLVVPVLDFVALLTLATDGTAGSVRACMEPDTLLHAARLAPGVQAVQLATSAWGALNLTALAGWGFNASKLIVRPQTPVPTSLVQRCAGLTPPPPATVAATSGDDSSSSTPVGLIVGCTVGGVVLLAALAAATLVLLRRRNKRRPAQSSKAQDAEAPPTPDTTATSNDDAGSGLQTQAKQPTSVGTSLLALLQSQEQQLLGHVDPATTSPPAGQGASSSGAPPAEADAAPSRLTQAHEQLMSLVVAGGAAARESSRKSMQSQDHRQSIKQKAAMLQGAEGADTVVLTKVLGRGGSGIVYLGMWRGLPVAVKTTVFEAWEGDGPHDQRRGGDAASTAHLRYVRAIMETAISASVGHQHVVATYLYDIKRVNDQAARTESASGTDSSLQVKGPAASLEITHSSAASGMQAFKVFLVQELCTCSLHAVMEHGVLECDSFAAKLIAVAEILRQIASGLEYLHGLGIIHGDLTPGNVLLKMDATAPGGVLVKLADFGLSQRLGAQATHVSNFGAGTPFYVAPEVVAKRRTSPAADVFSFGVIAWQLFTGQTPWTVAPGTGAMVRNPDFPSFPPDTAPPLPLQQLVHGCLMADPRLRPTAEQAGRELLGWTKRPASP